MKTIVSCLAALSVLTFLFACEKKVFVTAKTERFVVYSKADDRVNKGYSLHNVEQSFKEMGGIVQKQMRYLDGFVVDMPQGVNPKNLTNGDLVIERDIKHRANIIGCSQKPDKPVFPPIEPKLKEWGVLAVNAVSAWEVSRGDGVKVCVLDTGVCKGHPDLDDNILGGESFVGGDYDDDNGHGCHVSGIIAALDNSIGVTGVAPGAKIFAAKVLDAGGTGWASDIADGIISCVNNGVDIINASLGAGSPSGVIEQAVQIANQSGVLFIAAAGNESGPVGWPAAFPEAIAVSSIDEDLGLSFFSNTGPEIEFAGPGGRVVSTVPGDAYAEFSGTSMAAPHVAGVAAVMLGASKTLLRARNIGLSPDEQGNGLADALLSIQDVSNR